MKRDDGCTLPACVIWDACTALQSGFEHQASWEQALGICLLWYFLDAQLSNSMNRFRIWIRKRFLFFRINLVPQNGGQNEAKRVSTVMSLKRLHVCWSKGLASDFLCLKRREGEKRRDLLNRKGRRRRWNWLGLGLLDFDLDLVLGWWAWTRWGLSRAAVGGVPGSSLTGNNERWTKEFNTDEDFSQSVTVSH